MISICIPSWNSLQYLKILISSIKKNTKIPHQIIVHDNGSTDGTSKWCSENGINNLSYSSENLGFCAVNKAINKARYDYCLIANSDMYFLSGWDLAILNQINQFKRQKIERFTISCNLIESSGYNPEFDIFDAGTDAVSFNEQKLLNWYSSVKPQKPTDRQFSHPILIPKFMLDEIGGFDEKYFPGWSSDMDLPMALYKKGCRDFIRLGNSRVYHFISKTFSQLPTEIKSRHGQDIFYNKWGMTVDEFRKRIGVNSQPYSQLTGKELE